MVESLKWRLAFCHLFRGLWVSLAHFFFFHSFVFYFLFLSFILLFSTNKMVIILSFSLWGNLIWKLSVIWQNWMEMSNWIRNYFRKWEFNLHLNEHCMFFFEFIWISHDPNQFVCYIRNLVVSFRLLNSNFK